ncbi:hypothetical protein FRC06_009637 [Ceratobasidium sp. 370]|nr:hypothetical protein FRC06_009637 [Ceratobasidium sp. 370]
MVRFTSLSVVFVLSALSALAQLQNDVYEITNSKQQLLTMNGLGEPCTLESSNEDVTRQQWVVERGQGLDVYSFKNVKSQSYIGYTGSLDKNPFIKDVGSEPAFFAVDGLADLPYYIRATGGRIVPSRFVMTTYDLLSPPMVEMSEMEAEESEEQQWTFTRVLD